jgi:hypothetical protein
MLNMHVLWHHGMKIARLECADKRKGVLTICLFICLFLGRNIFYEFFARKEKQ